MGGTGVEGDTLVGEDGVSGNVVEVRGVRGVRGVREVREVRGVRDIRAVSDELGSNPEI